MGPAALGASGSVLNHSLLGEVVILNELLVDRAGMGSKGGGGWASEGCKGSCLLSKRSLL